MKEFIKNNLDDALELVCLMQILLILSPLFFIQWAIGRFSSELAWKFDEAVLDRIDNTRYFQFLTKHGWK
ncbi:hypothetical protein PP940_gp137 [Rhizobium phage RL2RES]|uniref:Uncharacterized protein n=1 Tax=Rhizobium phage RL2RES TaxID=103371 RepID=A0A6B9J250_9CAUD|nr:hypothetical protein PP940_gp137 [Rhizobium phage RL2RES]QGZ14330.1 hypothetical protein RL2RES_137 [Rhizobium phage RL2RES]